MDLFASVCVVALESSFDIVVLKEITSHPSILTKYVVYFSQNTKGPHGDVFHVTNWSRYYIESSLFFHIYLPKLPLTQTKEKANASVRLFHLTRSVQSINRATEREDVLRALKECSRHFSTEDVLHRIIFEPAVVSRMKHHPETKPLGLVLFEHLLNKRDPFLALNQVDPIRHMHLSAIRVTREHVVAHEVARPHLLHARLCSLREHIAVRHMVGMQPVAQLQHHLQFDLGEPGQFASSRYGTSHDSQCNHQETPKLVVISRLLKPTGTESQ